MMVEIGERIKVVALFGKNIRPLRFRWKGRTYHVREITYRWKTVEGEASLIHFSVSDGSGLYELTYNQKSLEWRIEGVEA